MKTKLLSGIYGIVAMIALVFTACSEERIIPQSNNGSVGVLNFTWSQTTSGDTVILSCNQMLSYSDNSGDHILPFVATVKLFVQTKTVEYVTGDNPLPVYLRSKSNNGYEGQNPRNKVIRQELYFDDEQVISAILSMPVYSYFESGKEMFYPHMEFQELIFSNVSLSESNGLVYPTVTLLLPWRTNTGDKQDQQSVAISYAKKAVAQKDVLIERNYRKGIDWNGDFSFSPYVEKTEIWQIAGPKTTKASCPWLDFAVIASENKSIEVTDFNFDETLTSDETAKQDISQSGWIIKKGSTTKTADFSNGKEFFSNSFTYPLYDVSFVYDGNRYDFDLSVHFRETYQIAELSETSGKNTTTATIEFAQKSFEKTVVTAFTKKSPTTPDPQTKYGKILGYKVTAVFEPSGISSHGEITKKCVLIHYEKGYEWGICAYSEDFPTSYTFTSSDYEGYNSAAKHDADSEFELARVVASTSSILWYNASNRRIAGIDALTCKIYGWKNIVDGYYSSEINGYTAQYDDNYTITITSPSGKTRVFSSY